jgi:uroporphyrinogen decarboxylase
MMKPVERVRRALERRDHDRVPRFDQFWPETIERWRSQGLRGDPDELFDFDFQWVGYLAPAPYPGRRETVAQTDETEDVITAYGETLRYWKGRTGTPEHLGVECSTPAVWHETIKPRMTIDNAPPPIDQLRAAFQAGRKTDRFVVLCGRHALMTAQSLLGTEGLLISMASDPDWVRDIARTFTDLLLQWYEAILAAGVRPDALWCFDDLAYTQAPFMSPQMYRELFWPSHRRTVEWAHARGIRYIQHTDGDVRSFMDLFVEAGMDCLQPMEAKANMDVRHLAPRYGDRISFFGNIDMTVASGGDRERLEHEVVSKLAAGMRNRGYIYHSDHSVPPGVAWEDYRFIHELLDGHGRYA